jgi:periplasmic protein TonB
MLEQTPRREAGTNGAGPVFENRDRRRMLLALVLLLLSLTVVLVKNREIWSNADETVAGDDGSPVWNPNSVMPTPSAPSVPAAKAQAHVAAKVPVKPANTERAVVASNRTAVPPLEIEVVGGDAHSNSVKVTMPAVSGSRAASSTAVEWGPATVAAERVQMASDSAPAVQRSVELPYPLLARQMKVQGSVLLQAFIGADGVVQDLRVLSGPPILASAAREAARGWRFRPYLQNGQPVETQATIAVNFTINVLNNGTRDQMTLARGGE